MMSIYTPQAIKYFTEKNIPIDEGMNNLQSLLGQNILIKIGGECFNEGGYDSIGEDLAQLYELGIIPTITHGGGSQIDKIMEERGLPIIKINGLRVVPDKLTLDAVADGLEIVNNLSVNAINKYSNTNVAVGLMDEKIVYAQKHPEVIDENGNMIDLGYVGQVIKINHPSIDAFLKDKKIPVLWCMGYDEHGQLYNVNGDHVGEKIARGYDKFITLTSIGGYRNKEGKIVSEMSLEEAKNHKADGGMKLKIESDIRALEQSKTLEAAHITSPSKLIYELFLNHGSGTIIRK